MHESIENVIQNSICIKQEEPEVIMIVLFTEPGRGTGPQYKTFLQGCQKGFALFDENEQFFYMSASVFSCCFNYVMSAIAFDFHGR